MLTGSKMSQGDEQARRAVERGDGKGGVCYPGSHDICGPAVAQKYKVHQNAPY